MVVTSAMNSTSLWFISQRLFCNGWEPLTDSDEDNHQQEKNGWWTIEISCEVWWGWVLSLLLVFLWWNCQLLNSARVTKVGKTDASIHSQHHFLYHLSPNHLRASIKYPYPRSLWKFHSQTAWLFVGVAIRVGKLRLLRALHQQQHVCTLTTGL